jgi:hypothetical protein
MVLAEQTERLRVLTVSSSSNGKSRTCRLQTILWMGSTQMHDPADKNRVFNEASQVRRPSRRLAMSKAWLPSESKNR